MPSALDHKSKQECQRREKKSGQGRTLRLLPPPSFVFAAAGDLLVCLAFAASSSATSGSSPETDTVASANRLLDPLSCNNIQLSVFHVHKAWRQTLAFLAAFVVNTLLAPALVLRALFRPPLSSGTLLITSLES